MASASNNDDHSYEQCQDKTCSVCHWKVWCELARTIVLAQLEQLDVKDDVEKNYRAKMVKFTDVQFRALSFKDWIVAISNMNETNDKMDHPVFSCKNHNCQQCKTAIWEICSDHALHMRQLKNWSRLDHEFLSCSDLDCGKCRAAFWTFISPFNKNESTENSADDGIEFDCHLCSGEAGTQCPWHLGNQQE